MWQRKELKDDQESFIDDGSTDSESAKQEEGRCWRRCLSCCCCCCSVGTVGLAITAIALFFFVNVWLKYTIETVGGSVLGTEVSLGALNFGLRSGRVSLTDLAVHNPTGYKGKLLELDRLVFDLSPVSLLTAWLSDWDEPIVLEEFSGLGIKVHIDMNWTNMEHPTVCNAQVVVDHMNKMSDKFEKLGISPLTPPPLTLYQTMEVMLAKVKADKVHLADIGAATLIYPFLGTPLEYTIKEVLVTDVGEKSNGVPLWEFIEILIRAVIMAVTKAAPENICGNLARVLGPGLWKDSDFSQVSFNSGSGLEGISEFTGWAAGKAALLPLTFTALQAKITGQAIETSTEMNLGAAKVGMDMDLEATKANLAVSTAAAKANLAATAAVAKAGLRATELGTKLRTAFTSGLGTALIR